jgi:hypothetical protein
MAPLQLGDLLLAASTAPSPRRDGENVGKMWGKCWENEKMPGKQWEKYGKNNYM